MSRGLTYSSRLHFHFVVQRVTLQFKGARRGYHARVIHESFAYKMNSDQGLKRVDLPGQCLPATAALRIDQLQIAVFENAEETILPMGL
jgi:hypothetical protein